jgi:hypothetical protein
MGGTMDTFLISLGITALIILYWNIGLLITISVGDSSTSAKIISGILWPALLVIILLAVIFACVAFLLVVVVGLFVNLVKSLFGIKKDLKPNINIRMIFDGSALEAFRDLLDRVL